MRPVISISTMANSSIKHSLYNLRVYVPLYSGLISIPKVFGKLFKVEHNIGFLWGIYQTFFKQFCTVFTDTSVIAAIFRQLSFCV